MKKVVWSAVAAAGVIALVAVLMPKITVILPQNKVNQSIRVALPSLPEAVTPAVAEIKQPSTKSDLPNQKPLPNPPQVVKGIYITGWSAGSTSRITALVNLIKRTELNTVVVDIKDYSGYVSYHTGIPEVVAAGAEKEIRIAQPNALIKRLHDEGIYVIGRITDFQDPILANAHPEWALKNKTTGGVWKDNKGLAWMDPAAKPVWEYLASLAEDGFARGFDEIQFDYIRFASDGTLGNISYPYWDQKTPRAKVIDEYFKFLRSRFPDKKISADLFGLATIDTWDDMGIGQIIEDAYANFDYVSPMVYPSHFAVGFMGYKNPAAHPYEVVDYSMTKALARIEYMDSTSLAAANSTATPAIIPERPIAKIRPWLQDFSLGATYDTPMVRKQIQATYDVFLNGTSSNPGKFGGWLLWSAANTYTEGALQAKN